MALMIVFKSQLDSAFNWKKCIKNAFSPMHYNLFT